ncbi:hypothetical protein MCBRY_001405 [Methylocystis bryophila]
MRTSEGGKNAMSRISAVAAYSLGLSSFKADFNGSGFLSLFRCTGGSRPALLSIANPSP